LPVIFLLTSPVLHCIASAGTENNKKVIIQQAHFNDDGGQVFATVKKLEFSMLAADFYFFLLTLS